MGSDEDDSSPSSSLLRGRRRSPSQTQPRRSSPKYLLTAIATGTSTFLLLYLLIAYTSKNSVRRQARRRQTLIGFPASRIESASIPPELVSSGQLHHQTATDLLDHSLLTNYPSPQCELTRAHKDRYAPLYPSYGSGAKRRRARGKPHTHDKPLHRLNYYIALNLYSSSEVLPALIRALYAVATSLGPHRFHISIYENGSTDTTPAQLYLLSKLLAKIGVGFTIESSTTPKAFPKDTRIAGLAELRNKALKGVYEAPEGTWDRVLFINDVIACEADLLELLLMHEVQGADQSCGMDYKELRIKEFAKGYPLLAYDVWVAREMIGLPFYKIDSKTGDWKLPTPPMPHSPDRFRLYSLLPFQVFSCFNGLSVLSSSLFHPPHSLRFRSINGTDRQSECFLLSSDIWRTFSPFGPNGDGIDVELTGRKKLKGRGAKIQVVPRVSVGYDMVDYGRARQDGNTTAFEEVAGRKERTERDEMIEWKMRPPRLVASYPYGHWNEEEWIPPFEV